MLWALIKDPFNKVIKENVISIVIKTTDVSSFVHLNFSSWSWAGAIDIKISYIQSEEKICWRAFCAENIKKPKNKPSLRDSALDGEKNGETVEQNVVVLDKDSRRRRIRALETKCDVT